MKRIEGGRKAKAERKKQQHQKEERSINRADGVKLIGGEEAQREPRAENRACLFFLFFPLFPFCSAGSSSFCAAFPFLSTFQSVGPQCASTSLSTTQHPPYLYSFDSSITVESIGTHHSVIWLRFHYFLSNYQSFFTTLLSAIRIKSKQQL